MNKKVNIYMISVMGLLIALIVVLWNFLAIETQFLKISFDFVPKMIIGILLGPFWSAIGALLADIIGNTLFLKAPFFIGFTLNKLIEGYFYGAFFYKKNINWRNTILCTLSITILINFILTPFWLSIMYNVPIDSLAIWIPRLIKTAIVFPIQVVLIHKIGNSLPIDRISRSFRHNEINITENNTE
ncbi:folate family ECF transporter S component [Enterococcus canintestini]|uniref:folate family ECF transporter S component n=1 Tax=Enterococcus canintestini TaxID=317010 RepID=UPI00288D4852|nr:folate family ECF transporter S component [Enterococcus canintestini]MDT2738736.1 folate family ECF transporter S component [Enterococcus canintestini]